MFSQSKLDSLLTLFESTKGDNIEDIKLLNEVAKEYSTSYPSISEKFANKALSKSTEIGSRHEEANAYLNIANLFRTRSDLTKALEFGFSALNIYEELKDSSRVAVAANAIGRYYSDISEWEKALEFYRKSLALNRDDLRTRGNVINNIGSLYHDQNEYDSASIYFDRALEIQSEAKDLKGVAITLGNIGIIHAVEGNTDKAIEYYNRSIEMKKELVDFFGISYSYINMGNLHRNIGKYDEARKYYKTAIAYTDTAEAKGVKAACYQRWARSERRAGNEQYAIELEMKSRDLEIEVMRERQESEIKQLEAAFNLDKREKELMISEQNVLLLEKDQRIKLIQLTILIVALILMSVIFYIQRSKTKKERELEQTRNKLLEGELEHKSNELSSFTINFIQKQDMMEELSGIIGEIKKRQVPLNLKDKVSELDQIISRQTRNDKEWEDFRIYFEKVHNNFFKNLKAQFPDLSISELRLAALIKLKLSIKESASVLGISPDSVKTARYRLRNKLNLEHEQNLTSFLIGFGG